MEESGISLARRYAHRRALPAAIPRQLRPSATARTDGLDTVVVRTHPELTSGFPGLVESSEPMTIDAVADAETALPNSVESVKIGSRRGRPLTVRRGSFLLYSSQTTIGLVMPPRSPSRASRRAPDVRVSEAHCCLNRRTARCGPRHGFLTDLREVDVEQTKRRGEKLVVVDPETADRYHSRCDQNPEQPSATSVSFQHRNNTIENCPRKRTTEPRPS